VVFENQSSQNAATFAWSFPGGTPATSAAASPSVTYQQPGTYTATLIVGNPAGADTISQSIVVGGLPTGTLSTQVNGSQVTVQVNAFNATVLSWNFGDGNESTEANPTHTYTADGDYLITLTLGNVCGQTILTNTVTINTALPVAGFSSVNRQGCAPLEVIFSNESSANAQTFVWQFPGGNPETSTETHPRIIYETPGVFTVSLTASNSNGGSAITRMDYVVVRGLPTAGFAFQMMEAEVAFQTAATQEPGTSYRWDFGDGNTSELPAPTHIYSAGGSYTVSLELSNECGSIVSTMEVNIIINHIREAPIENGWSVYPNPSSGRVIVFKDQLGDREPLEWVLRDVLGHTLKRVRLDAAGGELRQAIDLDGLPSGVYVWSVVKAGDQTVSGAGKLVITQ
jgi:PKD repeat protein